LWKMCEASAYVLKDGREELILQDVDLIEPDGDNLRLVNIFGEQKVLKAKILSLNLVNHKVILVEQG
ncbi:MAG: CooT family nickel-binding protein, partial [Desulfobaccales bacterium]